MIEASGACTILRYDNLRAVMLNIYQQLCKDGADPRYVLAGIEALSGYQISNYRGELAAITSFISIPVVLDATVPENEMRFMRDGQVVGKIGHIS